MGGDFGYILPTLTTILAANSFLLGEVPATVRSPVMTLYAGLFWNTMGN